MEKVGGVFFSLMMGGVLFFALFKIYTHKQDQWDTAHPEHASIAFSDTLKQAKQKPLPCRK